MHLGLGGGQVLIRTPGPMVVVLDARTCAWLEQHAGLSSLRVRVRGTDPAISSQLEEVHAAAMTWRDAVSEPKRTDRANRRELGRTSEWLTTSQAADLLGISPRAIQKRIACGDLEAERVGRAYRISQENFRHYRAAHAA